MQYKVLYFLGFFDKQMACFYKGSIMNGEGLGFFSMEIGRITIKARRMSVLSELYCRYR